MSTSHARPEPYRPTLAEAFEAAGQIAESVYVLESFAADLEERLFSDDVLRLRQSITLVGDRLARLIAAERSTPETRPAPATTSGEATAAGAR